MRIYFIYRAVINKIKSKGLNMYFFLYWEQSWFKVGAQFELGRQSSNQGWKKSKRLRCITGKTKAGWRWKLRKLKTKKGCSWSNQRSKQKLIWIKQLQWWRQHKKQRARLWALKSALGIISSVITAKNWASQPVRIKHGDLPHLFLLSGCLSVSSFMVNFLCRNIL